ncbi:hypothetical protein PC119_g24144 [Phytophthora cactorum]|uniref:F-box domain-containing protein n=1 Tax=Phytophthora cactorum TaxID=29920 RepID=A0A8T1ANC9_9STRA|nr:hypothetical protein PC117_g25381 [Phytophthora cactorum]KAG2968680.1 hypothetical protein PC119_g24144 [Phytophthora cactorum]
MLTSILSSLPSPTVPAMSSRLPHLNSFVVLTKEPSSGRLSRRRYSIASSCPTTSNSSDDESDASDLEPEDCCVVYESYAAVTKRNNQPASVRWSDLQRVQNTAEVAELLSPLELCFEFFTMKELQSAAQVCTAFHYVVTASEMLLTGLYSRQWRAKMLPETYVTLPYRKQLVLCAARRSDAIYELSTRSAITHLPDGKYRVVNNSMLRKFDKGTVDSIRGFQNLPVLSCARALQRSMSYYEVSLNGAGKNVPKKVL